MTTTVTSTIKSSGGDYTSLSAWQTAKAGDIVSVDQIQQAECYDFALTDEVTLSGWTTDATHYVRIYTPTAERHDGTASTGFSITDNGIASPISVSTCGHVRLEGLVIKSTGNISAIVDPGASSSVRDVRVSNCVVVSVSGTSEGYGLDFNASHANTVLRLWNNIIYDFNSGAGGGYGIGFLSSTAVAYVYNNTVYNCRRGIVTNSTNQLLKNNICDSNQGDFAFVAGPNASSTNNLSSDSSVSTYGTGSANPSYADEASDDFHLASGDTAARGNGADLSADANLAFSDDIDGDSRSAWDIGADEFVGAGGDASTSVAGSASTSAQGTSAPSHTIAL